jgi:hypothetical protein
MPHAQVNPSLAMIALSILTVRLSVLTLAMLLAAFGANTVGDLASDFDFGGVRFSEAEVTAELTART